MGQDVCQKCLLLFPEGACVSECPDGYYGDEDTNDCEECHSDCETCNGFEASDCLSCEDKMVLENGMCVPENKVCPFKTFRTGEINTYICTNQLPALNESGI